LGKEETLKETPRLLGAEGGDSGTKLQLEEKTQEGVKSAPYGKMEKNCLKGKKESDIHTIGVNNSS